MLDGIGMVQKQSLLVTGQTSLFGVEGMAAFFSPYVKYSVLNLSAVTEERSSPGSLFVEEFSEAFILHMCFICLQLGVQRAEKIPT